MTQRTFKPPFPRYRERGSTSIGNAGNQVITSCNGTNLAPDYINMLAHREGEIEGCYDIVTPGFHSISAGGRVVVNPYWHVKQNFTGGGTGPIVSFAGCTGDTGLARKTSEYPSSRRHFLSDFRYGEVRNALDGTLIPAPLTIVDLNRLKTLAQTTCMSNVDVGSSQALVTAAEANRTLQLVARPLAQLDSYVAKQHAYASDQYRRFTAASPSQKLKLTRNARRPGGLRDALSGQYLGWYYGMKPLANDIENSLKAYLREGSTPQRETARGSASDGQTNVITDPPLTSGGTTKQRLKRTRVEEVDVRAGCLYSPTLNTYSKVFGLRLSDAPSSLWEATTLSFLVDYYLNIGNLLKALEPRIGITYLGNWLTVRQTVTDRIEVIDTIYGDSTHVIDRPGTEWAARVVVSTERVPLSNPYSYVGFARNTLSDNLQRNVAIAALISQRVKAIGIIYGAFAVATM